MYKTVRVALLFTLFAIFVGCYESEKTCTHAKVEFDAPPASWEHGFLDTVFVIDENLASEIGGRIEAALRGVLEGDQDGDGVQDQYAIDSVRVAIVRPESSRILQDYLGHRDWPCPQIEIPYASYAWYPYGFGDDPNRFIEDVSCLLVSEPEHCKLKPDRSDEFFGVYGVGIIVITDRDACEILPNDESMTNKRCNDDALAELPKAYTPGICAGIDVVSGVPPDLIDDTKYLTTSEREQYFQTVLDDPRMQWSSDANTIAASCTVSETTIATPPRALVENLKSTHDFRLRSVCSDNYLSVFDSWYSRCCADLVYPCHMKGVRVDPDGTVPCFVEETLPDSGPITHCEQLAEFGREPEPIRIENGRETCVLKQRVVSNAQEPLEYGWYYRDFGVFGHPFEGNKKEYQGSFDKWLEREFTWQTKGGFHPPGVNFLSSEETESCKGTVRTTRQTLWIPGSIVAIRCWMESCSLDGGYL